jgi:hypothetical protein
MSEPFTKNISEFIAWGRKKYWAAWDEEEDTTTYDKTDLSRKLQKVYSWTEREALESIDRALREFTSR